MNSKSKILLTLLCIFLFQTNEFAQTPNFSGIWVLNFEKSAIEDKDKNLTSQIFEIIQNGDDFGLKIFHIYGDKKRKIGFRMLADGKTRRVKLLFKGKLERTEDGLQATMWRNNYLNMVHYKFGANQNELIADETYNGIPKNHHSIWVFDKQVVQ
ncbi:MAG: hypothetical protein ACK5VM_00330 [Bacteroidota bacterium]|jgi:hypothetical protein|nr:hypothetical protein [Microcystis sp. M065S1]MCA6491715.1 hypothetical protein [Chitinophagaceae bacterium]